MRLELTDADAAQVRAILMTHAEMIDQQSMKHEQEHARLSKVDPVDADALEDLSDDARDASDDCANLKRLADLFQ